MLEQQLREQQRGKGLAGTLGALGGAAIGGAAIGGLAAGPSGAAAGAQLGGIGGTGISQAFA